MSSFDKVVKLACKPKAAPPKAKYIDPIIAATWSDDGSVHDVCKALVPRLREPNAVVVFKALIVLHTMIRNGATDNVLSYLSQSNVLRLRNIASASWEGYAAPQNLQNYAAYLESRINAYRDIKHDAIKVQAESNRDMRNSQSISSLSVEEESFNKKDKKDPGAAPTRSKTIVGRKLRVMSVEKGLLRETKVVHRMIDALVDCKFYLDDLEDELTITALRMLVKDLLILFQAGNEGVINVLEHYFEMSHTDATEALAIYRHFCQQTENVVEYLGVARKLQNLLNVSIPNLRHAPVSLAGALQEYLEDPNFEQNRRDYKSNKATADGPVKRGKPSKSKSEAVPKSPPLPSSIPAASTSTSNGTAAASSSAANGKSKEVQDFFSAIETEQPTMFNPSTNSPNTAYFQQQGSINPFSQMLTGQTFVQPQQTGFLVPQMTAVPGQPNPFGNFLTAQPTAQPGHRPFSSYLPQQAMGMPNGMADMGNGGLQIPAGGGHLLRPQATGGPNPFRQSMLVPQTTGMQLFGVSGQTGGMAGPGLGQSASMGNLATGLGQMSMSAGPTAGGFGQQQQPFQQQQQPFQQQLPGLAAPRPAFAQGGTTSSSNPSSPFGVGANAPQRPASTPLTTATATNGTSNVLQGVKTHQTGTKNPFGPVGGELPPVPKAPTLFDLSMEKWNQAQVQHQQSQTQASQAQPQPQQAQPTGFGATNGSNGFNFNHSVLNPGATDISSIASSFAFSPKSPGSTTTGPTTNLSNPNPLFSQHTATTNTTGTTDSFFGSSLSSQPTGATTLSSFSAGSSAANSALGGVKSHTTGMAALKPFKPTSSFGASLVGSLPPIPASTPSTPAITGLPGPSSTANGATSAPSTTPSSSVSSPANQLPNFSWNGFSTAASSNPTSATNNSSFLANQPTGATGNFGTSFGAGSGMSTLGVGLRPQMTGGGGANPFRASMAGGVNFANTGMSSIPPLPAGFPSQGQHQQQPFAMGSSPFGAMSMNPQQPPQTQQSNGPTSLI